MRPMNLLPLLVLALSACVQTGEPQFEPDYKEAARINTQLGMDYLSQGRVELAQFKFEKALEQDDGLARTHLGMALVHEHFQEYSQADGFFKEALDLAPRDHNIQTRYASFLCARGESDKAEKYFERARGSTRNPEPHKTLVAAGACYRAQQNLGRAETALRQALEIAPRYGPALLEMAQVSYQRNDFLRARAFLQRYESVQPANVDSLLLALRVEHQLGDERAAREYARRLKNLSPGIDSRYDLVTGQAW